ncbi:MAG: histidine kinase, partial [Bacteroidia bacterium]|nr:histidine kinase [Bacteroidia bacterium]
MSQSYFVLGRLLNNRYRLIHHAIFVFLIFFFWFLFSVNQLKKPTDFLKLIAYSMTYVTIAYFNIYFLFSRYLMKNRIKMYVLLSVLTFIMSYLTQALIYIKDCNQLQKDLALSWALLADMMINAITYCMFIGIGLSVKMIKMWMNSEQKVISLEQENLKAKLSSLKSQISPHFLFNTFNNLYVLSKTNPKIASEMILGFSDLMRYQLNESEKEKVAIENEVEYIKNFLVLEKLRKDKLDLRIDYDKETVEGLLIEPLLFVTLIENA